mmetsp:Transcript_28433/g.51516  ORF Transcript_28433/g.51516 Transcript_28433/m.51516 type:complete len:313 (+) Transcript_28433:64-1002(+)
MTEAWRASNGISSSFQLGAAVFILMLHFGNETLAFSLTESLESNQRTISGIIVAGMLMLSDPLIATAAARVEWNLGNGMVQLEDPLMFPKLKPLHGATLLGSGGGGAVFSFQGSQTVVKISWLGSAASVERECAVLKTLENTAVQGVERCIGQTRYLNDSRRVMIAMEPLMEDAVASVLDIDKDLRPHAVECIVRTMVQMLAANVVTIDVQPLISRQTGDVIFIDLTEATELKPPLSFLERTLISSFCTEMAALIPEYLLPVASNALLDELKMLEQGGAYLSKDACDSLGGQSFLVSDEIIGYTDKVPVSPK